MFEPHCTWVNHQAALVKQLYGSAAETLSSTGKVLAKRDRLEMGRFYSHYCRKPVSMCTASFKESGSPGQEF